MIYWCVIRLGKQKLLKYGHYLISKHFPWTKYLKIKNRSFTNYYLYINFFFFKFTAFCCLQAKMKQCNYFWVHRNTFVYLSLTIHYYRFRTIISVMVIVLNKNVYYLLDLYRNIFHSIFYSKFLKNSRNNL